MDIEVYPFAPAEASELELRDLHSLVVEALSADIPASDVPGFAAYVTQLQKPATMMGPRRIWLARQGGRLAGVATVSFPDKEDRESAVAMIRVPPRLRRQGIGTALLAELVAAARSEGRTKMFGGGLKAGGDGEKWATALGFAKVQELVWQRLLVADFDAKPAVSMPDGFRVERWIGSAPEALLASYAHARTAMDDAPMGDAKYERPQWTPTRVRQHEADAAALGEERRVVSVVHEASQTVVGFTEMKLVPLEPNIGYQQDTGVLTGFRGSGFGRILKIEMMTWLMTDQPNIESVVTGNAADNNHMIRINQDLGYAVYNHIVNVEAKIKSLDQKLSS